MPPIKPVPAIIKRICTPYLDRLCPVPKPCPVPPPCPVPDPCPLPHADTRILIDSLFTQPLSGPLDTILADLCLWKAIGVKSLVFSGIDDSPDLAHFVGLARKVGFKIILPTPQISAYNFDAARWLADIPALAKSFEKYQPDGWYVDYELNIGGGGLEASYRSAIATLRAIRDITIYLSPYYFQASPIPSDGTVWANMERFCTQVSEIAGSNVISALQDGIGCDYNMPRRVTGSPELKDFLAKARLHKEVFEAVGWKATINVELFDTYPAYKGDPYPPTAERIKSQIESAGQSAYVSQGMGLGPCWHSMGVSLRNHQVAAYEYHQQVAEMLIRMKGR